MIKLIRPKAIVLFILQSLIVSSLVFSPILYAAQLSLPAGDLVAPEITQPQYIDNVAQGQPHKISVKVTDNVAVKQVVLFYRVIGHDRYKRLRMQKASKSNIYSITIPPDKIPKPGIEYYIQATDTAGNTLLHGYAFSPLSVKTSVDAGVAMAAPIAKPGAEDSRFFSNKWLWIGLGVLAVGAAAGGGSSGDAAVSGGSTLSVSVPVP